MRCWKPLEIPEHWHILCNTPQRIQRGAKDIASCILNSFEVFQHANHFSINCQEVFLEIDQLKGLARPVTNNQQPVTRNQSQLNKALVAKPQGSQSPLPLIDKCIWQQSLIRIYAAQVY